MTHCDDCQTYFSQHARDQHICDDCARVYIQQLENSGWNRDSLGLRIRSFAEISGSNFDSTRMPAWESGNESSGKAKRMLKKLGSVSFAVICPNP